MLTEIVEQKHDRSIIPVHSFDLWGTLVKQDVMGERVLEAYRALSAGKIPDETIDTNTQNYRGILLGDKEALEHKKQYVDAVEEPLWKAYEQQGVRIDFDDVLYQDCLHALEQIAEAGQEYCIITTGKSPWIKDALQLYDPALAARLVEIYSGNKTEPEVFESAYQALHDQERQMVTHTEDQMKGFEGLLKSDLTDKVATIYVERENLAAPSEVLEQGVTYFLRDLSQIDYAILGDNYIDTKRGESNEQQ